MTDDPATWLARELAAARTGRRTVRIPEARRPSTEAQAYAVQAEVARLLGPAGTVRGWKVGAAHAQAVPSASPVFDVRESPGRVASADLGMIGVEAEVAVRMGRDLPARGEPYSAGEVLDAIATVHAAIEVCDTRLADWREADDLLRLADNQLNFALILGEGTTGFRTIDFAAQPVVMEVDGAVRAEAVGGHAVGNPLSLLPWLAAHAARFGGLRRDDAVTTGAWLGGMQFVEPGAEVRVRFADIGEAVATFPA